MRWNHIAKDHTVPLVRRQRRREAANFYASVFKNAKIKKTLRCGIGGPVRKAAS